MREHTKPMTIVLLDDKQFYRYNGGTFIGGLIGTRDGENCEVLAVPFRSGSDGNKQIVRFYYKIQKRQAR